jgi:trimethylamine---corrinoid protein Co-methyltransferase
MTEASKRAAIGRPSYLSEDQKRDIYRAALEIIGRVGMVVHHDEALAMLRRAGADVGADERVRLPRSLVERARAGAPSVVPVFDRSGALAMELGGYNSYFGTGSDLMSTYDLESGERRPSTLADIGRFARLCDALPNIDFIMSSAYPNDVEDPHRAYLESFRAMVCNSTKPLVMTAENAADLRVMWQAAGELRGGPEELRRRPYFVMYGEPSSPLAHPVDSMEKLLFCADWGIPAIYSPAPLAGATAPITVAGHTAQGVAESLFGLVIHQVRRPGSPFLFGIGPAVLDMSTAQSSYNSPEYLSTYLCAVEMAKWLDLPNWGYAGTSDSQVVDAQAGMEIAELTLLSMLFGSNLNHDVGYLDFGLTGAPELVVIVEEYIALNRRLLGGIVVDRETLAVETIDKVGPGGDFISSKHTQRHVRSAQWRPSILNRKGYERWREDGALDLGEQARRKARTLLEKSQPTPLDEGVARRIDELVGGFGGRQR